MSDPRELTGPEQRAILIMARWAHEAGLRRCRWSLPNDASWPHSHLAGLPVRHDGLPNQYDLLARAPWRPERVVCSLHRSVEGYEVTGVPGEEWLRREPGAPPAPVRARPRVRLSAAAAGLLIPVGALGGFAVVMTDQQDQAPPAAVAPTPPLPANADAWASAARVRLAAMSQQLETLTAAEAAWTALPPERRAGETPSEVRELQSALAELSQRRAALAAELDALDALREARTDLAATEERLAEVRSALALGDTEASPQLRDQADRLGQQSAEQRGRLASWQEGVDQAIATPLPAPVDATQTADAVVALTEQDPPPATDLDAPVVAAGREVEPGAAEVPDEDAGPDPDGDEPDRHGPDLDGPDLDGPDRHGPDRHGPDREGPDHDQVELDTDRHEFDRDGQDADRDERGGDSDQDADQDADHGGVEVPADVNEVNEVNDVNDGAPVAGDLPQAGSDAEAPAPSDAASDATAEPDREAEESGEIGGSPAGGSRAVQPEAAPETSPEPASDTAPEAPSETPSEARSAPTPAEREQINKEVNSLIGGEIDAAVKSHTDDFKAAADRMEGMTLNDLLRQGGETDQELRERLTKAAQDYQRQAGSTQQR